MSDYSLARRGDPGKWWTGVDLDGCLAQWMGDVDEIGPPLEPMAQLVRHWIETGRNVRIFTARVCGESQDGLQHRLIRDWCAAHFGVVVPITCVKDPNCIALYDDRAVRVEHNTGRILGGALYDETGE